MVKTYSELYHDVRSELFETEGADASQKFLHLIDGFTAAFQSPLPSFHPSDLLIGLVIGCVLRLLVYEKSRNAKKYRRNEEYGSARWSA